MVVVDSNVLVYFWLQGPHSAAVTALFQREPQWEAPILWRSEFRNVLAHYLRKGDLSLEDVKTLLADVEQQMLGHEHIVSSEDVMSLVADSQCSAYDCEFVALALQLDTQLFTFDRQLLRSFPGTAVAPS